MRRLLLLLLTLAVLGAAGLVSAPAQAVTPLVVTNGVTDNYKPKWNADPTVQEHRTWLQLTTVTAAGVTYRPTTLPATGWQYLADQPVTGSDGSTGTITASAPAGGLSTVGIRTDATGQWGVLVTVTDPTTLRGNPVPLAVTLSKGGVVIATTTATYTWDATLTSVPADHVEYNSPGGRWWFGCVPTRADWEAAAPASTCSTGAADLTVALSSPSNVGVGDSVTATVTVSNTGTASATGVRVVTTLPAGLRVQSVTPGAGMTCTGSAPVTCTTAALAAGARTTVAVAVAAIAPGTLTTSVSASSATTDPTPATNTASRGVLAEGFACTLVGTAGADTLTAPTATRAVLCGLGGNDVLTGAGGNDQLYGGDGNDTLRGAAGDDVLTGGPGDDTIDGGTGSASGDRVSFADARSSMVVNLAQLHAWDDAAVAGDAQVGYDAITAIEGVVGSPFDDQLLGGPGADRLEGVGGADRIYGYGGNDVLDGGVGNDLVYGQDGDDVVRGGNGDDQLSGGTGVDALDGQLDVDTCTAGGQVGDTTAGCER